MKNDPGTTRVIFCVKELRVMRSEIVHVVVLETRVPARD